MRLLTPNWMSRLPGYRYEGDDPDGYMTMPEVVDYLTTYAEHDRRAGGVAHGGDVGPDGDDGYRILTTNGEWPCRTVVLASGPYNRPDVPALAEAIPSTVRRLPQADYRNPDQLEAGGVLVVGAAATGVQLADEIHRSGRPVTLAVGHHVRLPRVYRGMDIMWWLDAAGVLDERHDEVDDIERARHVASFQLVGSPGQGDRRSELAPANRRPVGRPARRRHRRRQRPVLRLTAQPVCALPISSSAACSTLSTSGPSKTALDVRGRASRAVSAD